MNEFVQIAIREVTDKMHAYMRMHPESELHQQGKMFGVLVYDTNQYLAAFSAKLDGSYYHEGFVPPVFEMPTPPVGTTRTESQRLQRLLFANYRFINGLGETKNLLDIFAEEKPIIPAEEWFSGKDKKAEGFRMPPSGAGECCAPKLLQYALTHDFKPIAMTEFWIGAPSRTEIRHEGTLYAPCSGRCQPILRHILRGLDVEILPIQSRHMDFSKSLEIIYEDDVLWVVNKPSGMLSVPGKDDELSVADYLSQQRNNAYCQAVHRLDQDTSGLLVLAKTPDTYKTLQAYFQRRDILKRYEAVIQSEGVKELPQEGMIELPLLPNPYDRPRQIVNTAHGKPSITRFAIRKRGANDTAFVDFFPLTGRTHQLRVHAAHPEGLNAPIVGDRLYGGSSAERLMLHAAEIRFVHPITKEEMHFCIPSNF